MILRITPAPLSGSVAAIPSKSDVHRLLIAAALADRETRIACPALSEDIEATVRCLTALGAAISYEGGAFLVTPLAEPVPAPTLDCGESGSTLRFLLPVAAALSEGASFTGHGRLPERPIGELVEALAQGGASVSGSRLPLSLRGRLQGGDLSLPGNVSSQYITGLLFALPLTKKGGSIRLTTPLQSSAYVDMTLASLARFGITVLRTEAGFTVPGEQVYRSPGAVTADGDWSNAAFFLAAGALGPGVTVTGLDPASVQGDKAVLARLRGFGASVTEEYGSVSVRNRPLIGSGIDLRDTPDLLPPLAVLAALSAGETVFTGARRLRMKESDRLKTVAELLTGLGGIAAETADGLKITGTGLAGGTADAAGDHRVAMAAAIAASYAAGPTLLRGAEAVNKSYPGFWDDFKRLGGKYDVIDLR